MVLGAVDAVKDRSRNVVLRFGRLREWSMSFYVPSVELAFFDEEIDYRINW